MLSLKELKEEILKADTAVKQAMLIIEECPNDVDLKVESLEKLNETLEKAAIISRNALERFRPHVNFPKAGAPVISCAKIYGTLRIINYNWLHIKLNTLLPHCRYQTPAYLSDTITLLLNTFVQDGGKLPFYKKAMLVIDEYCDCESRTVYDQDNKGWKAVSNALKGRVFSDDDQFTLGISLLSEKSKKTECNIYVFNAEDTGEFFNLRYSELPF